jgi:AcrR family transcriptional regulator
VSRRESRTDAILDAALRLIAEVGYDRMTMDAIAARAGASKATIYRRWPGKSELVIAALSRHRPGDGAAADTGAVRKDLAQTLAGMRDTLARQDGGLVLGLINAMRGDPELAEVVRRQIVEAKSAVIAEVVRRAIAGGQLPAGADYALAAEVASALVFSRLLVTGQPMDDGELAHLVDAVLLPVLMSESHAAKRRQ